MSRRARWSSGIRLGSSGTCPRTSCSALDDRELVAAVAAGAELHLDVVRARPRRPEREVLARAWARRLTGDAVEGGEVVDVLRPRVPKDQVRVRAGGTAEADEDALAALEPDRIDVALVVPEVDGRVDANPPPPERGGGIAGVVVRLELVSRRRPRGEQLLQGGVDVEPAPAAELVPLRRTAGAAGGAVHVVRRARQQLGHLLGTQVRPDREQDSGGGTDLRGGKGGALTLAKVVGRAHRVALLGAFLHLCCQCTRERRDDPDPWCGDVVVDLVPVREDRD